MDATSSSRSQERAAMEQGQDRRAEGAVQAEGHLGPASSAPDGARVRELALLNLGIDSKLRGCDLVALKVRDICTATRSQPARSCSKRRPSARAVRDHAADPRGRQKWIKQAGLKSDDFLFPSRIHDSPQSAPGSTRECCAAGSRKSAWTARLRHALDAANQGDVDLPADQEPACRAAAAWPLQARLSPAPAYVPPHWPPRMNGGMQRWT